jgi:IS30 family transposase
MDERRKIARWRMAGICVEVIAEKLGRHRSTIFRELRRNTFEDQKMPDLNGYYCVTANSMARERRAKLRKLARFSDLRQSVIDHILHGWVIRRQLTGFKSRIFSGFMIEEILMKTSRLANHKSCHSTPGRTRLSCAGVMRGIRDEHRLLLQVAFEVWRHGRLDDQPDEGSGG